MKSFARWLYCALAGGAMLALAFPSPVRADSSGGRTVYLPFVLSSDSSSASQPGASGWLAHLNTYRAAAGLSALSENTTWSSGDTAHAKYTVLNNVLAHSEDPTKPYYTSEGNTAAENSNVMSTTWAPTTDEQAIDMWMQGPYHALGILDPRLGQTGFGSYHDPNSANTKMAAALDVLRGLGAVPSPSPYPVMWPGRGAAVSLGSYDGNESPDPLATCSGYTAPTGLPVILQLGSGSVTPHVTAHSFAQGSTQLASCIYDETTFSASSLEHAILNMRDAIVLIPRVPLVHGQTYSVSITNSGTVYSWSFTITN